ncbi:MAG: hypothetical protein ACLFWD_04110 [Anaerolineales bacterium]
MSDQTNSHRMRTARIAIISLVALIIVLGFALIGTVVGQSLATSPAEDVDALAASQNECVVCHRRTTPGIVKQFGHSTMAAAEVVCTDCHEVESDYPGAVEHEGTHVLASPTTAMCEDCHQTEVAQFYQSRHSLPAYVAYAGAEDLTEQQLIQYESIP